MGEKKVGFPFSIASAALASAATKTHGILLTDKSRDGHRWKPISLDVAAKSALSVPASTADFDLQLVRVSATDSAVMMSANVASNGDISEDFVAGVHKTISTFHSGENKIIDDGDDLQLRVVAHASEANDFGLSGTLWLEQVRAGA